LEDNIKIVIRKWGVEIWSAFIWLRTETSDTL
jgi:hypothetical protein